MNSQICDFAKAIRYESESDSDLHRGVFADLLEEAGLPILAANVRGGGHWDHLLSRFSGDRTDHWAGVTIEEENKLAVEAEAKRIAARNSNCLYFGSCVTGCLNTLEYLGRKITRRRPRGSGSKSELAKRLRDLLNLRADQRWERATKGQRKPSERQAAELHAKVEAAVAEANGRSRERLMDAVGVIRVAVQAITDRFASDNGGEVTANSYGYSWSTTTARAYRLPTGEIQVRVGRDGKNETKITAPAKWWLTVATQE